MSIKECTDLAEAISLEPSLGLYLKPYSRIKINVQLPRLNCPGQSISSWHVMEKVKETVWPDTFNYLKTLKIASNIMKLEGELETKTSCDRALARLKAASSLKVNGFSEKLQIRAAHAAVPGPTRHDWEAFFRDAKGVNEMKPGERPDTIHLEEVPVKWFLDSAKSSKPSEKLLQRAFGTFGKVRRVEVKRNEESKDSHTFGKTSSLHSESVFEVYIQYEEYVEFSIAMDSLRGKKLLYKEGDGKVYSADIKVDFDRTNYLSEKCIKLREAEAQKLHHPIPDKAKSVRDDVHHKHSKPSSSKEKGHVRKHEGDKSENKLQMKSSDLKERDEEKQEAKLLLRELLLRVEKHKRKMDKETKSSEKSHKHNKVSVVSRSSKDKHSTVGHKRESNLEVHENKCEKSSSKGITDNLRSKEHSTKKSTDGDLLKRSHTLEVDLKKPSKKSKSSLELIDHNNLKKESTHEGQERKPTACDKDSKDKEGSKTASSDKSKELIKSVSGNDPSRKNYKSAEKHSNMFDTAKDRLEHSYKTEAYESLENLPQEEKIKRQKLILQERLLKEKLVKNLRARQEEKLRHREKLRKELAGRKVLKSVLADKNNSSCKKT